MQQYGEYGTLIAVWAGMLGLFVFVFAPVKPKAQDGRYPATYLDVTLANERSNVRSPTPLRLTFKLVKTFLDGIMQGNAQPALLFLTQWFTWSFCHASSFSESSSGAPSSHTPVQRLPGLGAWRRQHLLHQPFKTLDSFGAFDVLWGTFGHGMGV